MEEAWPRAVFHTPETRPYLIYIVSSLAAGSHSLALPAEGQLNQEKPKTGRGGKRAGFRAQAGRLPSPFPVLRGASEAQRS